MKNQWDFIPDVMKLFYTLYFSLYFLPEIDFGYVQLIKVTAPDGTIPIKTFNVT